MKRAETENNEQPMRDAFFEAKDLRSGCAECDTHKRRGPSRRGPSGCGKTTLLDMLAAKKTSPYSGKVFLNGRPRDRLFPRVTSYVPHQDVMPPYWTVAEAVEFNHRLRIDAHNMPDETRRTFCGELLALFGLLDVKDSIIGDERVRGISSGQRRRVTLARGYVGGAQIVFADEPTSGLSATDAETCMRAIAGTSRVRGVTFVVVIHQPRVEVAAMFDHLTLMTSHPGRVVYNGPFSEVKGYFTAAGCAPPPDTGNPADFYLDVITPGTRASKADEFVDRYLRGQKEEVDAAVNAMIAAGGKSPLEVLEDTRVMRAKWFEERTVKDSVYSVPWATQVTTLMRRRLALTLRDKTMLKTRMIVSLMQGTIVGVAFLDIGKKLPVQQISFLFMLLQMGALSNMVVMPEMIAQRLVLKFENSDALYSIHAAVFVDTLVNNTLAIAGNFVTSIIMYSLSGLSWNTFDTLYFWSFMCFMTMTNFFKVIAAVAPSAQSALQTAMPGLMLFILFNNFFVNQATAPFFMKWALYVSPMAWGIEQIVMGIYGADPTLVTLYGYDASSEHTIKALAVLITEICFFQLLSLACLRYFNNISR